MFTQETGRFYLGDALKPTAEITFVQLNDKLLSIDHTFVDESLQGQGLAGKLVDAVADYTRQQGMKLSATCSYARRKLDTDDKYKDIAV